MKIKGATNLYSLLIKDALVIDGSGHAPVVADIGIRKDRIADVRPGLPSTALRVIDARGLAVAPGFIDLHTHTDQTIFLNPAAESKILQGVTTDVVCNCGIGPFPSSKKHQAELASYLSMLEASHSAGLDWHDCAGFMTAVENISPGINILPLIGHGALRIAAMGSVDRPPTAREMARMEKLLAENLSQGAWGMSTGLIYPPGSFAKTDELVSLGRILRRFGGLYTSHVRGESATLLDAIDEVIHISRESGIRAQVSHLKAIGRPFWGDGIKALNRLEQARTAGIDIWADQYPYLATSTALSALVPSWAQDGGLDPLLERLAAPELKERLRREIASQIDIRGGADRIRIASTGSEMSRSLCGLTLADAARLWQITPEETVMQLLITERGSISAIFFSLSETDLDVIIKNPAVAVASDGYALSTHDTDSTVHPRSYGTFPRVLATYVRDKKLLSLEAAVRKMTALPAHILDLPDRGSIKPNFIADLTVFDPSTVKDTATFENPCQRPEGIAYVIVSGEIAAEAGKLTGRRAGRVLRKNDA